MGYKIPFNWAFDQFHEYIYTENGQSFALDKVAYSGRYSGFDHLNAYSDDDPIENPTNDIYIDRAKELFKELGVSPTVGLQLNNLYTADYVAWYVSYKAGITESEKSDGTIAWCSFSVVNGTLSDADMTLAQSTVDNLQSETKIAFNNSGGLSLLTSLTNTITNGTITIGIGIEYGCLKLIYQISEDLWTSESVVHTLYVEVNFVYRNMPATKEQVEYINSVFTTMGVVGTVVLVALFGGVPELLSVPIMNIITQIIDAAKQLITT